MRAQGLFERGLILRHGRRHHIGHQQPAILGDHQRFLDLRVAEQTCLDFPQFNTQAANLHLMVNAPDVFDDAVRAVTGQVAGAIQALAGGGKWVGYILFGGQGWLAEITPGDPCTGQVQLGSGPGGYGLQVGIEDVTLGVAQRSANARLAPGFAGRPGGIGGVFGGAVQVIDLFDRRLLIEAIDQRLLQWLTREVDDAHALGDLPGTLQGIDRRRHGVDQAHLVAGRQVRQLQGIAREDQRAAVGQGDENFPH